MRLPDTCAVRSITEVDQGSPAEMSGLRPGDIIFRVGSTPVTSAVEAQRELNNVPAGGTALVRVIRRDTSTSKGYSEIFLTVTKRLGQKVRSQRASGSESSILTGPDHS